jgi:hypothetical protein
MLGSQPEDSTMTAPALITLIGYVEVVGCVVALCFLTVRRQWREYWALGSLLAVRVISDVALTTLRWRFERSAQDAAERHALYRSYSACYWSAVLVESIFATVLVFSMYRLTMAPLKGLQRLGVVVLGAACSLLVARALWAAAHPTGGLALMISPIADLQRAQNVLSLGLLVFVRWAMRPMGLSYKSTIFGVAMGLALLAGVDLMQAAWMANYPSARTLFLLANGVGVCAAVAIWAVYFAMGEAQRGGIALRAGSPLLRLNRVATQWFE